MATVNIGGDQNDRNYRYKRPKVKNKIEGRGNGIKTVVPNMADIAKSLHVDPRYPTKYFGIELGAQSTFDKKREEAIVNGSHDVGKLEILMDKFIDVFILCPKCRLPELKMDVKKSIKITCSACGHHSELHSSHKLTTYILKNPPETKGRRSNVEDKDANSGNNVQNGGAATVANNEDGDDGDNSGPSSPTPQTATAAKSVTNGSKSAAPKAKSGDGDGDEDNITWESDTSEAAVNLRKKQEIEEMKTGKKSVEAIVASIANGGAQKETPLEAIKHIITSGKATVDSITSDLRLLQMSRGFDDTEKMSLLFQGIVENPTAKTIKDQLLKHIDLLRPFSKSVASMNSVLDGVEALIAVYPKLVSGMPNILHVLYDKEILSEDVINSWYDSPPEASKLARKELAADIRKKAKVFVEWLRADEEEEEEEEDS